MKFTLTIELGNEAMQTTTDVQTALAVALREHVCEQRGTIYLYAADGGSLRDENGNTVGSWAVEADAEDARVRIGNTPTCENCGETLDRCTCE